MELIRLCDLLPPLWFYAFRIVEQVLERQITWLQMKKENEIRWKPKKKCRFSAFFLSEETICTRCQCAWKWGEFQEWKDLSGCSFVVLWLGVMLLACTCHVTVYNLRITTHRIIYLHFLLLNNYCPVMFSFCPPGRGGGVVLQTRYPPYPSPSPWPGQV